jgi:hypothetical protein
MTLGGRQPADGRGGRRGHRRARGELALLFRPAICRHRRVQSGACPASPTDYAAGVLGALSGHNIQIDGQQFVIAPTLAAGPSPPPGGRAFRAHDMDLKDVPGARGRSASPRPPFYRPRGFINQLSLSSSSPSTAFSSARYISA